MDLAQVRRVRSFNRRVGMTIGALDDRFLGRGRPMGEARLLWETGDGADIRDLRARLGLDAGYMSRLLRSLVRQGLAELGTGADDRRIRRVTLTAAGQAERARLELRSDELAASLLETLDVGDRTRLVEAMVEVDRLLQRSATTIEPAPAGNADVRRCFARYFRELDERFEGGFDVARSNRANVADLTPPHGLVLVARVKDDAVGCGAMRLHHDGVVAIKRMWVAPHARGAGLGRRLLRALELRARAAGGRVARLETNRSLVEAVEMYRSEGYQEVPAFNDDPYADHWFEKRLDGTD